MNKTIIFLIILAFPVMALPVCEGDYIVLPCTAVTPNITCSSNYTIYNETHDLIRTGEMTLVNDSFYNFTLSNLSYGTYIIELCSGHTADITVMSVFQKWEALAGAFTILLLILILFIIIRK